MQHIPDKPISDRAKSFIIAEKGYFYAWSWTDGDHGPVGIGQHIFKGQPLAPTFAVMADLVLRLPPPPYGFIYHLYCDNLFTQVKLLKYLRQHRVAVTGTTRGDRSIERCFPALRDLDLKRDKIPFSTIYCRPTWTIPPDPANGINGIPDENGVMQFCIKDRRPVIILSTFFNGYKLPVLAPRRATLPHEEIAQAKREGT